MPRSTESTGDYAAAWAELLRRARRGMSWSGRERNCAWINTADGRFARVDALSGLDFADDGRALAVVDYDQDGDLDLWLRNRTAPRLRLMRNDTPRQPGDFLALRLRGSRTNRDGIGASVEVLLEGESDGEPAPRLVRSLRAGDLFLSQSSKWLHFGTRGAVDVREVRVDWPGRRREVFRGVTLGGRFLLEEGTGAARLWKPRRVREASALEPGSQSSDASSENPLTARIVLPVRVPFPMPEYRLTGPSAQQDGGLRSASALPGVRVLVLSSSSCGICRRHDALLREHEEDLARTGARVLMLSVDGALGLEAGVSESTATSAASSSTRIEAAIDAASLERIEVFLAVLFDRTPAPSVPQSFLVDAQGRLLAIYRGPVSIEVLSRDIVTLPSASEDDLHRRAPQFPGTWFTRPLPPWRAAEYLAHEIGKSSLEDSLHWLDAAHAAAEAESRQRIASEIVGRCRRIAREHRTRGDIEGAAFFLESALRYAPLSVEIHCEYGELLGAHGILPKAIEHFRAALRIDPADERAVQGLRRAQGLLRER